MTLPASAAERLPAHVPEPHRTAIAAAAEAWSALRDPRLRSLVLFGSTARGRFGDVVEI